MKSGKRKRRTPILFGVTFRLVLTVAAACLFLSYISSYIDPVKFSVPLFFGLYFIPILIINIILFLIATIWRSKSAWIPIIALLPALLFAERFFKFGRPDNEEVSGPRFSIETYNVGKFRLAQKGVSAEQALENITRQIQTNNPDIICLQEVFLDSLPLTKKVFPG